MEQMDLIHDFDDEYAAIRAAIEHGHGYKKSACHLWPAMKSESAYARLKACCNAHGDQRLRFGEILELMRFNNRFEPLYYLCEETEHRIPQRTTPEDEVARLQRQVVDATKTLDSAVKALERLTRPAVQAVK